MTKETPRQEARKYVANGYLRDELSGKLSDEAIDKIIDACSFVFKF